VAVAVTFPDATQLFPVDSGDILRRSARRQIQRLIAVSAVLTTIEATVVTTVVAAASGSL
jgi:hypothetical protein